MTRPAGFARIAGIDRVTAERTAWIARVAAIRDIALGVGLLTAVVRDEPARGWLWAGMLVDTTDAAVLACAGARRDIAPLPAAAAVVVATCGLAAAGPAVAGRDGEAAAGESVAAEDKR
nr:hypothetical protein [Frankia sp. Cppng1_Ct_nod]